MKCWICGAAEATTRDHILMAADVRASVGEINTENPFFLSTDDQMNQIVRSAKSKRLKAEASMCATCNNTLTQPYEYAWHYVREFCLQNWREVRRAGRINLHALFGNELQTKAVDLQLCFAKLLGNMFSEAKLYRDIVPIAHALFFRVALPGLRVGFAPSGQNEFNMFRSEVQARLDPRTRLVATSGFAYVVGPLAVCVHYIVPPSPFMITEPTWHPSDRRQSIVLGKPIIPDSESSAAWNTMRS